MLFSPRAITELGGMCLFDNLPKTSVEFLAMVAEDLEAAARTIIEATLWIDWWIYSAKYLALLDSLEAKKLKHLFVVGARCQLLVVKMSSTKWANLLLKRGDRETEDDIPFKSSIDLCNAPLSGSSGPFLREALEKAVEKSSRVLHDKAIKKSMTQEKPSKKPAKEIQFSQLAHQTQSVKRYGPQLFCLASEKGASCSALSASSKASSFSGKRWRRRGFESSLPHSQLQVGGVLAQHWTFWSSYGMESWTVEILSSGYHIQFHQLLTVMREPRKFLSYSSGSIKAQALQGEVDKTLEKGTMELVDCLGPDSYSHLFLVQKVMGGWSPMIDLSSLNRFVALTKFKMEMVSLVLGSIRKEDFMFSVDLKDVY